MKISYLHIRNKLIVRNKVREILPQGGATVAYTTYTANSGLGDRVMIRGAVAICVADDNYNRKSGRVLSLAYLTGVFPLEDVHLDTPPRRIFHVDLGPFAAFDHRVVEGETETMFDNRRLRRAIEKEVLRIVQEEDSGLLGWSTPNVEVKLKAF